MQCLRAVAVLFELQGAEGVVFRENALYGSELQARVVDHAKTRGRALRKTREEEGRKTVLLPERGSPRWRRYASPCPGLLLCGRAARYGF